MSARAMLAVFTLLALVAGGANAALFPDDEARQRIDATNQRLADLQQQIDSRLSAIEQQLKSAGLADLANQMQLLQADLAKLRGQIEVVNYELDQAQKRQRDLYIDLDTRHDPDLGFKIVYTDDQQLLKAIKLSHTSQNPLILRWICKDGT